MTDQTKPGMGFELNIRRASGKDAPAAVDSNTSFCIAVLGNFSGHSNQLNPTAQSLSQRKMIAIDRDNFDDVLAKLQPSLSLSVVPGAGEHISITINELDDFHPDALYDNLEVFSRLRGIRSRLQNNSTFDEAAREIIGWLVDEIPVSSGNESKKADIKPDMADSAPGDLLDAVLGSTHQPSTELDSVLSNGGIDRLVKDIIAPYVEPAANPHQQDMIDAVDEAIAGHMRQVLHHPQFQALEAAWRSIYFLTQRLETDRYLKIYLLDVSKEELSADLSGEVSASAMHKHFCEPAVDDISWSLLLGNYHFEDKIEDVLLLSQIGEIAYCAQAPFVAGARETIAGCESFAQSDDPDDWQYRVKSGFDQAWTMLRESEIAEYIGLALPRFLLRLPYGKKFKPVDSFRFEEMENDIKKRHDMHLWGNAAFIKAEQMARAYSEGGWQQVPGGQNRSGNLPTYYYDDDGEMVMMPCAEIYLTEKGGKRLSMQGLIAIWSIKNQDAIASSDFYSVAGPSVPLKGRWVKA